jgi:membrane protein YqaA with SNARE-associated domain
METVKPITDISTQSHDSQRIRRAVPWRPLLSFLATIALTLVLVIIPLDVERWGSLGYLGVFLLSLLSSATILVPSVALGAALKFGAADVLNPMLVGLVAGIAAGIGESTGYLAGRSGAELARMEERRSYQRIAGWVEQRGSMTVFLLAAVPLPLIDLAGIAAGALRMSFWRFQSACIAGKVIRFVPVALIGQWLHIKGWL